MDTKMGILDTIIGCVVTTLVFGIFAHLLVNRSIPKIKDMVVYVVIGILFGVVGVMIRGCKF